MAIAIRIKQISQGLQLQTIVNSVSNLYSQLGVASHVTKEQSSWKQKLKDSFKYFTLYKFISDSLNIF